MKNIFTRLTCLFIFSFGAIAQNNVTFQVDMNSVDPTTFTTTATNSALLQQLATLELELKVVGTTHGVKQ